MLDRSAFRHASEDYERALSQRDAIAALPRAWAELLEEANELIVEQVQAKAEALSGYAPSADEVLRFLAAQNPGLPTPTMARGKASRQVRAAAQPVYDGTTTPNHLPSLSGDAPVITDRSIGYTLLSRRTHAPNASRAMVEILRTIAARDVTKLPELGRAVRTRGRSLIAQSPEQINPARPDLARGEEIAPGWLVGLTVSNRDKMMIIRAACELYGLSMPDDQDIILPNA